MDLIKTLTPPPRPNPSEEVTRIWSGGSIDPMPYEGQTANSTTMMVMLWIVVFVVYSTFRTIPTVESYGVLVFFSTITGLSW
jgi:hypothetical protein